MVQRMTNYDPIPGDDLPYFSMALRDIPEGYHFRDLTFPERAPLTLELKDRLCDYCERLYRNHEIIGRSIVDWFTDLQLCLDRNVDNFEKFLAVYNEDIAKPVLGREVTNIHDETETSNGSGSNEIKEYDLPIDNSGAQEVNKSTGSNSSHGGRTVHYEDKQIMSDIGVTNNWEKLNGFLNENPTMEMTFSGYFREVFTIMEVLKW